jgi:hypothetical protein
MTLCSLYTSAIVLIEPAASTSRIEGAGSSRTRRLSTALRSFISQIIICYSALLETKPTWQILLLGIGETMPKTDSNSLSVLKKPKPHPGLLDPKNFIQPDRVFRTKESILSLKN